ncbi:MAG: hypothetical protein LN413_00215 [Candidatus Thermoplasmatota archaeon]|nr:hypothetical protein [Candidatus Thermoplasmatota archaeon]
MSESVRAKDDYLELCCRECGQWKAIWDFDPESILFSNSTELGALSLKMDMDTPLCEECSGEGGKS